MINLNSPQQLSCLLFGGTLKVKFKEPVLNELGVHQQIKSGDHKGEYKYKWVEKEININGFKIYPQKEWKTKTGHYQTNEQILDLIANKNYLKIEPKSLIEDHINFTKLILEMRQKEKLLSTYYKGFEKYIDENNLIHPQFSHCGYESGKDVKGGTLSGRLSCVKPNLQNIPK